MFGKRVLIAIAVLSALVGAHSFSPRELYNEMYPVEALKRDAFQICDEADQTFIRAVRAEREACLDSMPNAIELALGRAHNTTLTMAALTDPSRQAELLMTLAAMPPQQPITERRSFANIAWMRDLPLPCNEEPSGPAVAFIAPAALPPEPGTGRAAALDRIASGTLPALMRPAAAMPRDTVPVIPLAPGAGTAPPPIRDSLGTVHDLPAPDVGDPGHPAVVPLAKASTCGGI